MKNLLYTFLKRSRKSIEVPPFFKVSPLFKNRHISLNWIKKKTEEYYQFQSSNKQRTKNLFDNKTEDCKVPPNYHHSKVSELKQEI